MKQDITVVLLTGGTSTRFWPLLDKTTFVFQGKPFLYWHYQQLVNAGIKKCIVVTNENTNDSIRLVTVPEGLTVEYVIQKGQGMGQAVAALESILHDESILVLNASDYYKDEFITSFIAYIKNDMILGAVRVNKYFPGGYLKINSENSVEEIIEKPEIGKEPSDIVRIVADYFPNCRKIIDAVRQSGLDPVSGYENAINNVIRDDVVCKAKITELSSWKYLKYPWDVLAMKDEFFSHMTGQQIHKSVTIKSNVVIEGAVIIEEGVKIFEGTKIVGPVYIGKNTIIGNNNIIRHSYIGAYVVTGFSSDITRSYIGDDCWFHTNYIGDSVIGNNVSMGSGSVCANLRLDDGEISSVVKEEKIGTGKNKLGAIIGNNVRIGVNSSIMPGVKIGQNSFIGAGIVVDSDLEEDKFIFLKNGVPTTVDNTKKATASREEFRKAL